MAITKNIARKFDVNKLRIQLYANLIPHEQFEPISERHIGTPTNSPQTMAANARANKIHQKVIDIFTNFAVGLNACRLDVKLGSFVL